MKLNLELINKIYNNDPKKRLIIKNKGDKVKLSEYDEYIPMYDIFSDKIYPIKKENIYSRLIYGHYRFINSEVKDWIFNKYKKDKINQQYNVDIISNYDLETLEKTSYEALYKSSLELGLSISICKRNSFNKFSKHLKPYYSKEELIKLGQNMKVISEIKKIDINDQKTHYQICKKISKNDISSKEITSHNNYIIEKNLISLVCNYSFMGSYFMNKYLRENKDANYLIIKNINKLAKHLKNTPPLQNDYFLYRFIWDDFFLKDLKKGDTFIDKGFLSTTRDPFYSPGLKSNFGLILVKIKIPKGKNVGLLIENYSLFPKEEELLLPPNSKLKLISLDDKFKYYHTNSEFEKNINKKYEFEFISNDFKIIDELEIGTFKNLEDFKSDGNSKLDILNKFIDDYRYKNYQLNVNFQENNYVIFYNWYDSNDSYENLYYNKNTNGLLFMIYDEYDYPYLNIEFGEEMVVNFINKFYFYNSKKNLDENDISFLNELAYKFNYSKYILFLEYENFSSFEKKEDFDQNNKSYLYNHLFCKSLYEYLKQNKKFYHNIVALKENSEFEFGYWKLNKLKNTKIPEEIYKRYKNFITKNFTYSDLIIYVIENFFYDYQNLSALIDQFNNGQIVNPFKNLFITVDLTKFYDKSNLIEIPFDNSISRNDDNFKLIFRQPIRRII